MERLSPTELPGRAAQLALGGLRFVAERLAGGGWVLPHGEPAPARRPVRANITFYSTAPEPEQDMPANITVGEE